MRVPTPSEAAFLTIIGGVATVSSAILVPEIVEDVQEQAELTTQSSTPQSDFNNGFMAGVVTSAAIVGKVIYDKANNP